MQKYLAMLEDKIQWIAIGLGVLFCLFMIWTYVLNSPAQVTIGSETLGPSEVDDYTVSHVVTQLDTAINNKGKIVLDVPKHVQRFKDEMEWKTSKPPVDYAIVFASQPKDVPLPEAPKPPTPPGTTPPGPGPAPAPLNQDKVAKLPEIPAPTPGDHKFGRSLAIPPLAVGAAAPAPVVPGQVDPNAVDKDWVTQVFKVNLADIDKAFNDVNIPKGDLRKTCFLQVVLEREEVDAGGKPVPNTFKVIEPVSVPRNPGQAIPPYPPPGDAGRDAAVLYLQYASANQADIIQPLFYTTIKGDQWQKPGEQPAAVVAFDPATFKGDLNSLSADQKAAVLKYRQDKYKADTEAKKAARPAAAPKSTPGTGLDGPGNVGGGRNYAPPPPPTPNRRPPGSPPDARLPGFRPPVPRPGFEGGEYQTAGAPGAAPVAVPGLPVAGTDYPNSDFDPADPLWKTKTIEIWAHDTSVEAGKIYHYRIKYKIKNPLFATNAGADPKLNSAFDLTSKDNGPWASPVPIPQLVNFFVQSSKSPNSNTVRFEVFKWEKGQQASDSVAVGPGDQIGARKSAAGVETDFTTDWTVVDFRDDPRQGQGDTQILLVNNKTGQITARSYQADMKDPLYNGLKQQIIQQKAAEAAAQPAASAAGTGAIGK